MRTNRISSNANGRRLLAIAIYLILSLTSEIVWSAATVGAEFELTLPGMHSDFTKQNPSSTDEKKAQMRLVEHLRKHCIANSCKVVEVMGKWDIDFRIEYKDGWWFKVSYDPACVEITFKPSLVSDLVARESFINKEIFETAKEVGFHVNQGDNSHFNMGIVSAFGKSGKDFLRFFVDYANHPDLALGSLGHDVYNAPPLSVLSSEQRESLQKIIDEVNDGKLVTIAEIASAIETRVYTKSYYGPWGGTEHYQAVGLKYVNKTDLDAKDAPMELRAVWIQRSAEQFNLVAQLIEGRIEYLKTQKTPIVYTALTAEQFSKSELLSRFYIYVEEAGLHYQDFKSLLPVDIQRARLNSFVDVTKPSSERLGSIKLFWDLIPVSEWVQKEVIHVLSDPKIAGSTKVKNLVAKLDAEAAKLQPHSDAADRKSSSRDQLTAQAYKETLQAIKKNHATMSLNKSPSIGLRSAIQGMFCEKAF